jgi:hypothetical protein
MVGILLWEIFKTPRGTLIDVILTLNPRTISSQGVVDIGVSDWHMHSCMLRVGRTSLTQDGTVTLTF